MENGNDGNSPEAPPAGGSASNGAPAPCGSNAKYISTHAITVGTQCTTSNTTNDVCQTKGKSSAAVPEKSHNSEGIICNDPFLQQSCASIRLRTQTWPGVPQPPVYSRQSSTASNCATQTDPPPTAGSACLSVATPPVQAQECSADNVTVTVPPIRSELITTTVDGLTSTSQLTQDSVVCPRPEEGPKQPAPDTVLSVGTVKIYSAHYNLPKVIPIQNGPIHPASNLGQHQGTEPGRSCGLQNSSTPNGAHPVSDYAAPVVNCSITIIPRYPVGVSTGSTTRFMPEGLHLSLQQSPVSNLPPRPPSAKKSSITSTASSPQAAGVPQVGAERRPSLSSQGSVAVLSTPTSPQTQGVLVKPPMSFQQASQPVTVPNMGRRPSQTSQGSPSGVQGPPLMPTSKVPPLPTFPMGRYPSQLSSPVSPSGFPGNATSPFSSPVRHQESPSNSRPPSWYSYRSPIRGRDSSPSATSRDSLDSYIRSPPSGIYSTRLSQGNLLASRSSMDNLSVSSGDSVFDDIVSESEKKSLDEANESFGSVGSIPMVDADVVPYGRTVPQDSVEVTGDEQQTAPPRGRGVATVKQDSFDMTGSADPCPPTPPGPSPVPAPLGQPGYTGPVGAVGPPG